MERGRKFDDLLLLFCHNKSRRKWSRQESNLDLEFRKRLFYPLNYGTGPGTVPRGWQN